MSPDEIKKKLAEAGIGVNSWKAGSEKREVKSPIVERQRKLLGDLAVLLDQQIENDKKMVSDLHLKLQKLKQGGSI
jgi:hypothetical protein